MASVTGVEGQIKVEDWIEFEVLEVARGGLGHR